LVLIKCLEVSFSSKGTSAARLRQVVHPVDPNATIPANREGKPNRYWRICERAFSLRLEALLPAINSSGLNPALASIAPVI